MEEIREEVKQVKHCFLPPTLSPHKLKVTSTTGPLCPSQDTILTQSRDFHTFLFSSGTNKQSSIF
jgi:hypothetical protein